MRILSVFSSTILILLFALAACSDDPVSSVSTSDPDSDPDPNSDSDTELAVTGIEPSEGPAGSEVTISGTGFPSDPSAVRVMIGGVTADVSDASPDELTVTIPEGAESGSVEVRVDGQSIEGPEFTVVEENGEGTGDNGQNGDGTGENGQNGDDPNLNPYDVEGRVVESPAGAGIEGVEIVFSNGADPVETGPDGYWSVDNLKGPVAVSVQSDQWDFPVRTRLVLGESDEVDFEARADYNPPVGTRVAYQFREDCSGGLSCGQPFDIWVMDSNGNNKEQLTDDDGSDMNPSWSPDGKYIAYQSDRSDGETHTIWIMEHDGAGKSDTGVEGTQPSWSPDGEWIVFVRDGDIYKMDTNGSETHLYAAGSAFAQGPSWSPEGSKIAFTLSDSGTQHIWVMEADGSRATQVTESGSSNRDPAWHPSGDFILYSSGTPVQSSRFRIIDPDGSNDRTRGWPNHGQFQASWSPSGAELIYTSRSMIPFQDMVRWTTQDPQSSGEWMERAPGSYDAETEFWANSPDWAPAHPDE